MGGIGSVGRLVLLLTIFEVLLHPVRELDVVASLMEQILPSRNGGCSRGERQKNSRWRGRR